MKNSSLEQRPIDTIIECIEANAISQMKKYHDADSLEENFLYDQASDTLTAIKYLRVTSKHNGRLRRALALAWSMLRGQERLSEEAEMIFRQAIPSPEQHYPKPDPVLSTCCSKILKQEPYGYMSVKTVCSECERECCAECGGMIFDGHAYQCSKLKE